MHERVITFVNVPQQMLKVYYLYVITCHHAKMQKEAMYGQQINHLDCSA